MNPSISSSNSSSSMIHRSVVKNWKTTTIGVVIAFSGFVVFSPNTFGGDKALLVQICKYVTSGGLAALGITAKDFNVNGNSQPK
jgi:hypothetical protein